MTTTYAHIGHGSHAGHAVTAEEILSEALAWNAPHTIAEICKAVDPATVANLAHAIDRRVYMALKDHDEAVATAIHNYMADARETLRRNTVGWIDGH